MRSTCQNLFIIIKKVHNKYRMSNQIVKVKQCLKYQQLLQVKQLKVGESIFYICIAERVKLFSNSFVLFAIGETFISYDKQMLSKYPYLRSEKFLLKKIPLQMLIQTYIQEQNQLSIQYLYQQPSKKLESPHDHYQQIKMKKFNEIKFKFHYASARDKLIDIIINFRQIQKGKNITEQEFKKSVFYLKESQNTQTIHREYKAFLEQYKKLQITNQQLSKQIKEMQLSISKKEKQLVQINLEAERSLLEVNKLKQQLGKRQQEKGLMLIKQQQNIKKNQIYMQQISSLKRQISEKNDKWHDLYSISSKKYQQYEEQIKSLEQQKNAQITKNAQFSKNIQQNQTQISKLQQTKQKLQGQILDLKRLNQQLQKSSKSKDKNLMDQRQINANKDQQILKISNQLKINNQKLSKIEIERNQYYLKYIFRGRIFDNYLRHAEYLKDALQSFKSRNIIGSKLLFTYDPFNKTNFHQYIDHHPNLLIIIKTSLNAFIAGFSQSPFNNKKPAQQSGFISSITNRKVYVLQKGKKSISYDEYFIIFGNAEIRIKNQELKLFSNFGIGNGFYKVNQDKLEAFLSCSEKQVDIQEYEVYRIEFQT